MAVSNCVDSLFKFKAKKEYRIAYEVAFASSRIPGRQRKICEIVCYEQTGACGLSFLISNLKG